MNGGGLIAEVLARQGVRFLFTLCGGHIAPILVEAKARGVRVIDVRHEVTAVFAADAVARLTGVPGVAAVTAGPGVTNTITAIKNAQLAQSPLVLLGGATATLLRGRGSLQDIDQMALVRPHVKWAGAARRVRELVPLLERAFEVARAGVPGPVFLECPVDLLYEERVVRPWYGAASGGGKARGLSELALRFYLERHVRRLFAGADARRASAPRAATAPQPSPVDVRRAADLLARAERPVLLVGSQAILDPPRVPALAEAVTRLGLPVYLSGMARGLLGAAHPLWLRHRRKEALREADCVVLCGVPCDFRLDYGRHIGRGATLVSANLDRGELRRNRRPTLGVLGAPGAFLLRLAADLGAARGDAWGPWLRRLRERDAQREAEIAAQAGLAAEGPGGRVNPLALCRALDDLLPEDSLIVADGGDFVSTASYVLRPRAPLSWLDPGVFGTLGVGAGFALGAKLARPSAEVWLLYGDGSAGYSLIEADTFARHGVPVVALIGNDAGWTQIAREQVDMLKDDVGTVLGATDYERAAAALGAEGFDISRDAEAPEVLRAAQRAARSGRPAYVNARLGRTDFRKGSLSM